MLWRTLMALCVATSLAFATIPEVAPEPISAQSLEKPPAHIAALLNQVGTGTPAERSHAAKQLSLTHEGGAVSSIRFTGCRQ